MLIIVFESIVLLLLLMLILLVRFGIWKLLEDGFLKFCCVIWELEMICELELD